MHFASYGLSQPAIRRLAHQAQASHQRPGRTLARTANRFDTLERAAGLVALPVLAIVQHVAQGDLGFLPLDLFLLAASVLIARARLHIGR